MEYGIIFEGDASPLISQLSERLSELGLYRKTDDTFTPEMLEALNTYRAANRLIELDFCDPVVLRALGIDCAGDELVTLAGYADSVTDTEIGCYDACCEIVAESRRLGITVTEAVLRRGTPGAYTEMSSTAVRAAALALINQ